MEFKFSKDAGPEEHPGQPASREKGRQNALLALLLVLLGGFGYLYFFTDLIRPQPEQKPAQAPPPPVVKKPLPPPPSAAPATVAPAPPAPEKKVATVTPEKPAAPSAGAAKPAAPAAPAAPTVPAAPAPAAPSTKKAADAPKAGVAPAKPAEKNAAAAGAAQAQKLAAAPKESPKSSAASKSAVTGKQVDVAPPTEKKGGAAQKSAERSKVVGAKKTAKPAPAKKGDAAHGSAASQAGWTVLVGSYLLEDAMATDLVRVRKVGLEAQIQPGPRKKTSMNRLFLADFADRPAAQKELDKLKKHTSDAFILDQNGRFAVFAGSYLLDSRAASEKERLTAAGFQLTVKRTEVPLPSKNLTAGHFSDKSNADAALLKLKEAGIKASLVHR